MRQPTINLQDLIVVVADQGAHLRKIANSILRGFGTKSVIEVENCASLTKTLNGQRIDILLCDSLLPGAQENGAVLAIRRDPTSVYRTMPILIMTGDTRESAVRRARDSGANMIVAKPLSPRSLYDHLAWVALNNRPFVDCETYFGPDRRFKIEGYPGGVGRRKGDMQIEVGEEAGPALEQNDIDSLFTAARAGLTE